MSGPGGLQGEHRRARHEGDVAGQGAAADRSAPAPRVAIVVVNYKTFELTCECLDAVARHVHSPGVEVVVVDNASGDGSAARIAARFPAVRVVALDRNVGFGAGNNAGVAACTAPYVVLLNSDAIVSMDTPGALVDFLEAHADVACVGPRIDLPDGRRQPKVWGHQPTAWRVAMQSFGLAALAPRVPLLRGIDGVGGAGGPEPVATVGWISGVCMAMRRADFDAAGGFDPEIFMYCEDVDLCARLQRRGGCIVHVDDWAVMHYGGASARALGARLRHAVLQQRNLLRIVARERGAASVWLARAALAAGHLLRLGAGVLRAGRDGGYLLRASWLRLLDVLGLRRDLPA